MTPFFAPAPAASPHSPEAQCNRGVQQMQYADARSGAEVFAEVRRDEFPLRLWPGDPDALDQWAAEFQRLARWCWITATVVLVVGLIAAAAYLQWTEGGAELVRVWQGGGR